MASTRTQASERIQRLQQHLMHSEPQQLDTAPTAARDDDIVVCSALRTPIGRAKRGNMRDTTPDTLLAAVLRATVEQTGVNQEDIGDIVVGNVLQPGGGAAMARMAQFEAGLPYTIPLNTVNRQCSSGLQAFANIAGGIRAGVYDMGIAAGVESMSTNSMAGTAPDVNWELVYQNQLAQDCLIPMGITSENVAERYGITRERQDALAELSHARLAAAQDGGFFDNEIVPVTTTVTDEEGNEREVTISQDEGLRRGTTAAKLGKLKAAFKDGGTTTAGNSSQVSDGAAATLVARRSVARAKGLPIIGSLRSFAVVGVPPDVMGIGPAHAIPAALEKAGMTVNDIDIFEINEAFASQATYCCDVLNIPLEKVNPNGGAIAMGHPLGCTGNRQIATLLHNLRRRGERFGVVSMCIGTGMGAAAVFEAE